MFNLMNEARRQAGRALDAAGLGPEQCPSHVIAEFTGSRLQAYEDAGAQGIR
jgi:hypothetical protein